MINYTVELHPNKLEMTVSIEIPADIISHDKKDILLELPKWVPGDYDFEPYGRDVFSIQAKKDISKYQSKYADLSMFIEQVLSQDPRPAYKKKQIDENLEN